MADYNFNVTAGQTIARELLLACLNVGTKEAPEWKVVGKRVEDSSAEYDWGEETVKDILGDTYSSLKKPTITQNFDPCPLDGGDEGQKHIWDLAIVKQDAQALANQDMLIVHLYAGFAERYESCMVKPASLGGAGGGDIGMPLNVTYGGTRTVGTAVRAEDGTITFTPESDGL